MILWPWHWTMTKLDSPNLQELLEDSAVTASLDEDEELSKVAMKAVTQLVKSALDFNILSNCWRLWTNIGTTYFFHSVLFLDWWNSRWWFQIFFGIFTPKPWEKNIQFDGSHIFLRWVGEKPPTRIAFHENITMRYEAFTLPKTIIAP